MSARNANRKLKKGDLVLLAVVLCISAVLFICLWLLSPKGGMAVVTLDGTELGRYTLTEDAEVTLPEGHILVISDGEASVTYAPCRDQICVHHIPISRSGETIVCLPYRLTVIVEEGTA